MTYSIQKSGKFVDIHGMISRGIYREHVDLVLKRIVHQNSYQLFDLEIYIRETGERINAEDWWQNRIL